MDDNSAGKTHILFFSHYFPPEGNAPASRVHAMSRRWVQAGHQVTVITCAPNVPNGEVYPGYQNRLRSRRETVDGINVIRVWTYIAPNAGTTRRIANYLSYAFFSVLRTLTLPKPDVVIATSPQFFCGWAGIWASRFKRVPLILEIRDIWPESIVAVGALQNPALLSFIEWLERRMYEDAVRIVTVGNGYRDRLIEKGVPPEKLSIITNGVEKELFSPCDPDHQLIEKHELNGKFVCSYIGTIGMACGLEVALEAGRLLMQRGRDDIRLLLVGDGAEREALEKKQRELGLTNVIFTGRKDKSLMPGYLSISDCCLVHLRRTELFKTVLPSKIFEAAAMARPIILGVEGNAAQLIKDSGGGICIEPQNARQLVDTLINLADHPDHAAELGQNGFEYITGHYDRDVLAQQYLDIVRQVCHPSDSMRKRDCPPGPDSLTEKQTVHADQF